MISTMIPPAEEWSDWSEERQRVELEKLRRASTFSFDAEAERGTSFHGWRVDRLFMRLLADEALRSCLQCGTGDCTHEASRTVLEYMAMLCRARMRQDKVGPELMYRVEERARVIADGHVTVLRFTTGWKAFFGTPDRLGDDSCVREWLSEVPGFKTMREALEDLLGTDRMFMGRAVKRSNGQNTMR